MKHAFFVTRAKDNMLYEVVSSSEVDKNTGVISDEKIRLIGIKTSKLYTENLRMVCLVLKKVDSQHERNNE